MAFPVRMETSEIEDDLQEFTPVVNRKRVTNSPILIGSSKKLNINTEQEIINNEKLFVYIAGKSFNLTSLSKLKPIQVKKEIIEKCGQISEMKLVGHSVRITCASEKQQEKALLIKDLLKNDVEATLPRSKTSLEARPHASVVQGIVFGIPEDITDEELKEEIGAQTVKRLVKKSSSGFQPITTQTVVFSVASDVLPEHVYIGMIRKKVSQYIPSPLRCFKCQRYGHKSTACRSTASRCPLCAQDHNIKDCPNTAAPKCANCQGDHFSGSKDCPKYQIIQETLKVKTEQKLSYAAAVKVIKDRNRIQTTSGIINPQIIMAQTSDSTSIPHINSTSTKTLQKTVSDSITTDTRVNQNISTTLNNQPSVSFDSLSVHSILMLILQLLSKLTNDSSIQPIIQSITALLGNLSQPNINPVPNNTSSCH